MSDIYTELGVELSMDDDEISTIEEGFMQGYIQSG